MVKLFEDKYQNYFENFNKHNTLNTVRKNTFYKIRLQILSVQNQNIMNAEKIKYQSNKPLIKKIT